MFVFAVRRKKIAAVSLFLAALTLLLAGPAIAAPNKYKNAEYGFSFNYPETWKRADKYESEAIPVFVHAAPEGGFAANFNVSVSQPQNADSVTESDVVEYYKSFFTGFELLSFNRESINGRNYLIIEYIFIQGAITIRQRQYLIDHKNMGYTLTFTAPVSNFYKYEDRFKIILDSFRFRPGV